MLGLHRFNDWPLPLILKPDRLDLVNVLPSSIVQQGNIAGVHFVRE
jgi:hypothetical protein